MLVISFSFIFVKKTIMENKIWSVQGDALYLDSPSREQMKLENSIYTIGVDQFGRFFLKKFADSFEFDYKIYNLQDKLVNRLVKTYEMQSGNLGTLLNGVRGTGKSVTAKIMCNKLNLPTIIVSSEINGVQNFLNNIPQDFIIFVDEYEKIFEKSNSLLTIMDGALNSVYRRVFILTTNNLYIEENLKQRPGRLRYLKTFSDLKPEVVREIVDDVLKYKQFKDECVNFISSLELITVDIVKSVVNEVNMHNEPPSEFSDVFNVKKISGYYNIFTVDEDGNEEEAMNNVALEYRPDYSHHNEGRLFYLNDSDIGIITEVLSPNMLKIKLSKDRSESQEEILIKVYKSYGVHKSWSWEDSQKSTKVKSNVKFAQKIKVKSSKQGAERKLNNELTSKASIELNSKNSSF